MLKAFEHVTRGVEERERERIERERELRGDGPRRWESCVLIHKQVLYIYREQGVKG